MGAARPRRRVTESRADSVPHRVVDGLPFEDRVAVLVPELSPAGDSTVLRREHAYALTPSPWHAWSPQFWPASAFGPAAVFRFAAAFALGFRPPLTVAASCQGVMERFSRQVAPLLGGRCISEQLAAQTCT